MFRQSHPHTKTTKFSDLKQRDFFCLSKVIRESVERIFSKTCQTGTKQIVHFGKDGVT